MQTYHRILLIEDNRSIASALSEALQNDYHVDTALTGKSGIYKADTIDYEAVLLDLQLPDMYGLHVCQQLRDRGLRAPIIIISAEAKVLSKINLLNAGANDYITKPFSLGELKARLRVLVRNKHEATSKPRIALQVDDLSLDPVKHEVKRADTIIELRKKEFLLLECLMAKAGTVVSRQQLIEYAWPNSEKPWANTIDVHIKFLRDKIDRPYQRPLIQTVHGVGYKVKVGQAVLAGKD